MPKVSVKWGKSKFSDIECDTSESPMLLKAQLFALSGVQPDRQKLMVKGALIQDDHWGSVKLRDGMTLMMLGSADEIPQAPAQKTVFVEDMNEQQLATAMNLPAGLTNLGNTCYMNATLQCLRSVPQLKEALKMYRESGALSGQSVSSTMSKSLKDLFLTMDMTSDSVPPIIFLRHLHNAYPRFSEKNDQGQLAQQDANEFWTEIVRCLQQKLPGLGDAVAMETENTTPSKGFMDQYFAGEWHVTMKCTESDVEPATESKETFYQLSCFIEKEVKYMQTGLKSKLEEHITKYSDTLGRDAIYTKSNKLNRLPAYLSIQFVRFYYKGREAVNAKILKDVKFSLTLDVFDLCTPDLQQKLIPMREKFKEEDDKLAEKTTKEKEARLMTDATTGPGSEGAGTGTGTSSNDEVKTTLPFSFPDDEGSNNSGHYDLMAVLTHKGRSSSSGHYVAWVRQSQNQWLMFDDDRVAQVTSEDITKLSGGGDWHCAYVLLYGPKILKVEVDTTAAS